MASKTQERLLEELGGLFDGKTTRLEAFASGDSGLTESLAESVTESAPSSAPTSAGAEGSSTIPNTNVLADSGELFSRETSTHWVPAGGERDVTPPYSEAISELAEIAAGTPAGPRGLTQSLTDTVNQLGQAAAGVTVNPGSVAETPAGTDTRGGSSTTTNNTDSGTSVGSIATTFLESGFGIVPLITGLMGLFGGGSDAPPALEKYAMPSSISFESTDTGSGLTASDFDQTGAPRMYSAANESNDSGAGSVASAGGAPATSSGSPGPQITVNVQAMDAQSFMDYSSQIAQAVRGAMLNLNSVNDVVSEL